MNEDDSHGHRAAHEDYLGRAERTDHPTPLEGAESVSARIRVRHRRSFRPRNPRAGVLAANPCLATERSVESRTSA